MKAIDVAKCIIENAKWKCELSDTSLHNGIAIELDNFTIYIKSFIENELFIYSDIVKLPEEKSDVNALLKKAGAFVSSVWLYHPIFMTVFKDFIRLELRIDTSSVQLTDVVEKVQNFLNECDEFDRTFNGVNIEREQYNNSTFVGLML